jgi:hypothetical protein
MRFYVTRHLTGTDDHTPRAYAGQLAAAHRDTWKKLVPEGKIR